MFKDYPSANLNCDDYLLLERPYKARIVLKPFINIFLKDYAIMSDSKQKPVFSKEIDDNHNGQAIGLSFLSIGLILQFLPDYFGNAWVTNTIKIIFIIIGALGMCLELGKRKSEVKGLDNFLLGILFCGLWWFIHYKFDFWIINIAIFVLLFFGAYAFFLGLQQILYSVIGRKQEGKTKTLSKDEYLEIFTKVLGLLLVLAQIVKAIVKME